MLRSSILEDWAPLRAERRAFEEVVVDGMLTASASAVRVGGVERTGSQEAQAVRRSTPEHGRLIIFSYSLRLTSRQSPDIDDN